ncbi:MAG: endonuclease/exonuclease/phosphatase family protein, partial [Chitinophagales bacterium]|nr:endonuclease/exonuclease/phosphatase family protein [Chitinophagales bacterium]
MRIVSWNCNMAFRNKADYILSLHPDIVIIPECEHPDNLKWKPGTKIPDAVCWEGSNKNKGLGVFSYSNYTLEVMPVHNRDLKTIVPIRVRKKRREFILFAVWANNTNDIKFQYIGQVWKALQCYNELLKSTGTIWMGDFNSNTIWDKPKREYNHTALVGLLETKNIFSVYHKYSNKKQGDEEHSTFYLYRHPDKPYHIDYCFASADFISGMSHVEVGAYEQWKQWSD